MKPYLSINLFFLLTLAITSCTDNPDPQNPNQTPDPLPTDKREIRISPSFSTRATDFGFETDDCVGLFVVNYNGDKPGNLINSGNHVDNMRFKYSGVWTPDSPIYWTDDKTFADFYLYYPYSQVNSVTAYPFSVKADQSTEAAFKASDMMIGKALKVVPTSYSIVIPVDHIMSRIVIQLEAGNGFTKESLAKSNIDVRINGVKTDAVVNLANGTVTPTGSATVITPYYVNESYRALIVPQTVDNTELISVRVDGTEYTLKRAFTFESAKSYTFTVTLSKTSNGINVNINPWNEDDIDYGGVAE